MFFSSESILEIKINILLTIVFVTISIIPLFFRRRFLISIIIFSILENLLMILNLQVKSILFVGVSIYVKQLISFLWPLLNIFLIIYYLKSKK
jgi:hypothetical protein